MDMQKIGNFLAELRKGKSLTQEELGEQLGVTNKTVSRWENGNYLPPVEMLQMLSKLYDVSINELLSGERLNDEHYKEKAEDNIVTALHNSTASFHEKYHFYKNKWRKKHRLELIVELLCILALLICGAIFENRLLDLGCMLSVIFALTLNVRINEYVSKNFYDDMKDSSKK